MSIELKIKSKHLGEEAKIIRFEEKKILKHSRNVRSRQGHVTADEILKTYKSLQHHRTWDVRNENRATFLARAYIKGMPYASVEHRRKEENEFTFWYYIFPRVVAMVAKYGSKKKINQKIMSGVWPDRKEIENPDYTELKENIKTWCWCTLS